MYAADGTSEWMQEETLYASLCMDVLCIRAS